jgi:hypothetical protein
MSRSPWRACNYVYGRSEMTIEQINNTTEAVTYLHHDQAGSTRLLTSSTGAVVGAYTLHALRRYRRALRHGYDPARL